MNEPFSEELLSGYLDDELTSDERASVDQWLAASSDNRRLLDDLLAIRRELQALPQQHLDADFSERVLAAIRTRSGNAGVSGAAVDRGNTLSQLRPPLGRPAWQWFSAGVAAALACVIVGLSLAPESLLDIAFLPQQTHSVEPAATLHAPGAQPEPLPQQESLVKSFEQSHEPPQRDTRLQREERAPAAVDTLTLEKSRAVESRAGGMKQSEGRFASPALVGPGTPVLGDADGEAADTFSSGGAAIGRSRQERATFGTSEAAKAPAVRDRGDRWGRLVAETVAAGERGQLLVEVPSDEATQSAVTRKLQRTLTAQTSKGVGDNVQLRGSEEQSANQASDRFYMRQASDAWLDLQVASVEFVGPAEQVQQLLEELQHEQPQELLAAVEISLGDQQRTERAAAAPVQMFAKSANAGNSATPVPAPASAGAAKDAAGGSVSSDSANEENTQEKALSIAPARPLLEAGEREQAADKAPPSDAIAGKRGTAISGGVRRSTQLAKPGMVDGERRLPYADKKQATPLVRVRLTFVPPTAAREVPQAEVQPEE